MSVTVTLPAPLNHVGPGLWLFAQSTFIGPLPSDEVWRITCSTDSGGFNYFWIERFAFTSLNQFLQLACSTASGPFTQAISAEVADGASFYLTAALVHGAATVDDSGTTTQTWDNRNGLWRQSGALALAGGFGATDRSNLSTILGAVRSHYVNAP